MKEKDLIGYSNEEFREIRHKLYNKKYETLPYKLGNYIFTENPAHGNQTTRALRLCKLIDIIIVKRFMNGEI